MKIAIISDYPPYICGIARYTRYLVKALSKDHTCEIFVISEKGQKDPEDNFQVYDIYSRSGDFKNDILNQLNKNIPDVVHFQHDPTLYPDPDQFVELIKEIASLGIKIFVTVHTADTRDNRKINWKNFYSTVLEHGEIIVHNSMSVKSIEHFNLHTQKVHVIAHGTEFLTLPSKELARNQLHLKQDDFIFIILGFIHALKNHHTVISAFNLMKKKRRVKLLIAGSAGGNHFYNKLYIQGLKLLSLFNRNIIWHNRFVKDEDLPIYLAASDVLLLPYWQNYPSASGIFHLGLGARLPVICSDSVKFSEVKPYLKEWKNDVFVPVLSIRRWIKAMSRYIENPDAGQKISIALNDYAMETSWENIAKQHLALYKKDLK